MFYLRMYEEAEEEISEDRDQDRFGKLCEECSLIVLASKINRG